MGKTKHDAIMEILEISRSNGIILDELEPYFTERSNRIGNNFSIKCYGVSCNVKTLDYRKFLGYDVDIITNALKNTQRNVFTVCSTIQNIVGYNANVYVVSASKNAYIYEVMIHNSYNDQATISIEFPDENDIGVDFSMKLRYKNADDNQCPYVAWGSYFSEDIDMLIRTLPKDINTRADHIEKALNDALKYSNRNGDSVLGDKIQKIIDDGNHLSYLLTACKSVEHYNSRDDIVIEITFK